MQTRSACVSFIETLQQQQESPSTATAAIEDEETATILPRIWPNFCAKYIDRANSLALLDPHASPPTQYTFNELNDEIFTFASGLAELGLSINDKVSLFSENSARWLVADQAVQACGAADAVRGISSPIEELKYIMEHSQSSALIVQDVATYEKLLPVLLSSANLSASIRFVVLLWGDPPPSSPSSSPSSSSSSPMIDVLSFSQVLHKGRAAITAAAQKTEHQSYTAYEYFKPRLHSLTGNTLATLVYTSGTTGTPKGVPLTHANILSQVHNFPTFLTVTPGQRTLSLLPPWHIYERSVAYHVLSRGATQVYSNIRSFRDDLTVYTPDYLVCVPLVLETLRSRVLGTLKKASALRRTLAMSLLAAATAYTRARRIIHGVDITYAVTPRPVHVLVKAWLISILLTPLHWLAHRLVLSKIRAALGIRGCVVSGGGSLAPHLDDFFEAVGLPVVNGWGLTETSPVLACRRSSSSSSITTSNVRGSVGRVISGGTEVVVVDPETLVEVPDGQQGLLLARGPGVMKGYYNNDNSEATAAAFRNVVITNEGASSSSNKNNPKQGNLNNLNNPKEWFDTGDLGWKAPMNVAGSAMGGCFVLTGRAKDTIVLSSGENVEPQPIEDALCSSPFIKFAAVVGQGHRSLGALLVPDVDALNSGGAVSAQEVAVKMKAAVAAASKGRIRWECVTAFTVLEKGFSVEEGTLTRTMKPRRAAIMKAYAAEVAELESRLR